MCNVNDMSEWLPKLGVECPNPINPEFHPQRQTQQGITCGLISVSVNELSLPLYPVIKLAKKKFGKENNFFVEFVMRIMSC